MNKGNRVHPIILGRPRGGVHPAGRAHYEGRGIASSDLFLPRLAETQIGNTPIGSTLAESGRPMTGLLMFRTS